LAFRFKIWDQGNDGRTMGIRVRDVRELARLASVCTGPDLAGNWRDLRHFLTTAARARTTNAPYSRLVQVVWLNSAGYRAPQVFPGRTFVVTYTGPQRAAGGYASQGYSIVDPVGFPNLGRYHRTPVDVEYIPGSALDTLVVLP
jgi:hypothetical protein